MRDQSYIIFIAKTSIIPGTSTWTKAYVEKKLEKCTQLKKRDCSEQALCHFRWFFNVDAHVIRSTTWNALQKNFIIHDADMCRYGIRTHHHIDDDEDNNTEFPWRKMTRWWFQIFFHIFPFSPQKLGKWNRIWRRFLIFFIHGLGITNHLACKARHLLGMMPGNLGWVQGFDI